MLQYLQERRQDEKGFTLIELMVVVLIMGILMAIAIPTFLSTRSSANDASAKSNATNVFTNEKSYYASNQVFLPAITAAAGNVMDDTLPWGTARGDVATYVVGTTAPVSAVLIVAGSSSGNCFYVEDSETANSAAIGYAEMTGQTTCPVTTAFTPITGATAGSAAAHTTSTGSGSPTIFYSTY